jgi:hypothetical protein
MLDAIPTTPVPRGASPAKAGQKPEDTPEGAKFQQVYGKGEKPQAKPQDQTAEAEAPARKAAPPQDALPPLLQAPDAEALLPAVDAESMLPAVDEAALDHPDPDATAEAEADILAIGPAPSASPQLAPAPLPAPEQAPGTAPEQADPAPQLQSPASPFGPPLDDKVTLTRATGPAEGVATQDASAAGGRAEPQVGGREVEARAGTNAAPSTDETQRQAAPRADPQVAPPPRAAEVAAQRAEISVAAAPATDAAAITAAQSAAAPAPTAQPLQGAAAVTPPPAAVVEQLVVAAKQNSDGRVDLTLSPAELGRVRMTLLAGETGITVAIHADRDDTLDLFRRNADSLAQEFRQLGYGSVGFEFRGGGNSGQTQRPADDTAEPAVAENAPALPVGILRLTGIGGLDIRL